MDREWWTGLAQDWGIAIGIVLGVLLVWSWLRPETPSAGPAPNFVAARLDGSEFKLADATEPVVVLNFWATWCGPCRAEIPEFSAFHDENPDIGMYGISIDDGISPERLRATAKKLGISYEVLSDAAGKAADAYQVQGVPQTFVLDAKRDIRGVATGATTRARLEQLVERAR